jgi:thymidylate kinase
VKSLYRVEFIGVPGSGKSTVRKKLIERFKSIDKNQYLSIEEAFLEVSKVQVEKVYRVMLNILPKKIALNISNKLLNRNLMQFDAQNRFLAKWGKSFEAFLASVEFDKMLTNERQLVISAYIEIGSLFECINGKLPEKAIVFFEEGFVQKSFMFISPLDSKYTDNSNLYTFLDNIPLPDLIVYINADPESCYARMLARPEGLTRRLNKVDKNSVLNFLKICDSHLQTITNWLNKNKNINLIEINNNQDLDSVTYDLEKKIKVLFEKTG